MAERIDQFRRVLAGTARAIAQDAEADVVFASEPSTPSGKTARVPSPGAALEPRLVAEARGAADALALRLRFHDPPKVHARAAPADAEARAVFDALEMARVEALGARAMRGVRDNLARLNEARVRGDAIVRARNAEEVPLATAVGLIARERLTGEAPPRAAAAGLKLIAPWIEDKGGAELDALALTIDDQAAFAKLSRRLLEDLDLAAAEEPLEEQPDEAGDDEEGDEAGEKDGDDDGDEGAPSGGDAEVRGEDSDDEQSDDGSDEDMQPGDQDAMPGDDVDDSHDRRPAEPAVGTPARRPTIGPSPPASTRRSRPPSCATRRSSGGCALTSTSRWRAFTMSSPGSPTGFSGGCSRSQARSWDFDQEEGMLDAARLARVIVNPAHSLSYKVERETEFRDTVVTLLIDNSWLDARAADRDRGDLRRHPRPHARALRRPDRDPRLHHPRLEGRAEPRVVARRRAPGQSGPAQRPPAHRLQARRRALPPRAAATSA